MQTTRAERNAHWIAEHCVTGDGDPALLNQSQRRTLRAIYDAPNGPQPFPVHGPLAAYLALLHAAGPETQSDFRPALHVDANATWRAASPRLREALSRRWYYINGEHQIGPVPLKHLVDELKRLEDWREKLVWRPGFTDWLPASSVSEVLTA